MEKEREKEAEKLTSGIAYTKLPSGFSPESPGTLVATNTMVWVA